MRITVQLDMSHLLAACKRDIIEIYHHAVEAVKPERLVRQCVSFSKETFVVKNPLEHDKYKQISYDLKGSRVHVVGGGKCVLGMARGLAELALESDKADLFSHGCLSLPVNLIQKLDSNTNDLLSSLDIACKFGSKDNLPDEDSIDATNSILKCIHEATKRDEADGLKPLFIVLLSGGGSACLTSPRHITLGDKLEIIKSLVQAGAGIEELNTVRRFFSGVKGGKLAAHVLASNPNSCICSLIISDVVGDPLEFIASGPTFVSDRNNRRSMEQILRKYNVSVPFVPELLEPTRIEPTSVQNIILGNNKLAIEALTGRARELGYEVTTLGDDFTGHTHQVVERLLSHARHHPSLRAKSLIVCGGESTVLRRPDETWGVGGRTQEMALDYMIAASTGDAQTGCVDLFFAGSTDGQDGPTDVAGCFASRAGYSEAKSFSIADLRLAKTSHSSNSFWARHKPDWLVRTGPTGTNVMDLYVLMRCKS